MDDNINKLDETLTAMEDFIAPYLPSTKLTYATLHPFVVEGNASFPTLIFVLLAVDGFSSICPLGTCLTAWIH